MKLIRRDNYLDRLISVMNTRDIKVITGIRRCGKSKLLEAFRDYVDDTVENNNIIYVNYALPKYESLLEYHELIKYVEDKYVEGANNYILIDEVQLCEGFEKAINGFHAEEKYQIYITGSNAFLLSSELATLFTGRTFSIEVYPFSFDEYIRYNNYGKDLRPQESYIDEAFDNYFTEGGMPGSYEYIEERDKYKYIKDVFDTLIVQDIKKKYKIRNKRVLERLSNFLISNIACLCNVNTITNTFNSNGEKITNKTIDSYIKYLNNAFLFYRADRYDIKGKRYLINDAKYYLADTSFYFANLGTKSMNYGHIYENMVYIELLRRGYEVYVGKLYQKEIDFVAKKRDEVIYIQVSDNISNEKTFEREIKPLLSINDGYKKMIIARTRQAKYLVEGIEIIDISRWLKNAY